MSFVYAGKNEYGLSICSDTKLMISETNALNWGELTLCAMRKYGMIKCYIVNNKICISFAGNNIGLAHELFEKILEIDSISEEQVLDYAFKIHKSAAKNDIEFIICFADSNDNITIYCIKEGRIDSDVPNAWIGSPVAFRKMQELRTKALSENTGSISIDQLFEQAIYDCGDERVGGFPIFTVYSPDQHGFFYSYRLSVSTGKVQFVAPGNPIEFGGSAEDGAYTIEQFWSNEEVRLDIAQADLTILYSNRYRLNNIDTDNHRTRYFLLPILCRTSTQTVLDPMKR